MSSGVKESTHGAAIRTVGTSSTDRGVTGGASGSGSSTGTTCTPTGARTIGDVKRQSTYKTTLRVIRRLWGGGGREVGAREGATQVSQRTLKSIHEKDSQMVSQSDSYKDSPADFQQDTPTHACLEQTKDGALPRYWSRPWGGNRMRHDIMMQRKKER